MKKQRSLCSMAARATEQAVERRQPLDNILPPLQQKVSDKDEALLQELCSGVLRTLSQSDWLINRLMACPTTGRQRTVHYLIMAGSYQLLYTRIPPHAALAETVEGVVAIKHPQFKGLINGVLRQLQYQQDEPLAELNASDTRYSHSSWLLKRPQEACPEQWQSIAEASNQRPPMRLRVNRTHHSRDSWPVLLDEAGVKNFPHADYPDTVQLEAPAPAHALPGFEEGWVITQDTSAQGCVTWLAPQSGEHILDLCTAPDGKAAHVFEVTPKAQVLAVDIGKWRLSRVYDSLKRLGMKATIKQGGGRYLPQWRGEQQFDHILLDASYSAAGVIRHHPDIRWLYRDRGISELVQLQSEILDAIWSHSKFGGTLAYATCSVLSEENNLRIKASLRRIADAELCRTGTPEQPGKQNLPGAEEGDGFFYAELIKR